MRRALVAAVVLFGCEKPAELPAVAAKSEHEVSRDDARVVLETHCGECHIAGYPTAREGALRVFDLMKPDWAAMMSEAQLRNAVWRLSEPLDMHGNERAVPAADQERMKKFVELEVKRRAQPVR